MILILILIIIIILIIYYLRSESFQDFNPKDFNRKKLEDIDKSVVHFKKELNLSDTEIDLNSNVLNEYLNILTSDSANVNTLTDNNLPFIDNNNYTKYNHELKLLLNSKKIKQLFIINILKNKINYLSGSLQNIKEIKETQQKEIEEIKCQNL
jgi:hypothetical protein